MDRREARELELLTTIAEGSPVTQRGLAERLGIALGLTNLYLKRLAHKGHIKITTVPPNRIRYLVTPRGVAQKSRLTYEYLAYSLRLYRHARESLRAALRPLAGNGSRRIGLLGTGEAAELAYLTLKELGLEPAGIFDERPGGRFLGMPVEPLDALRPDAYDLVIVATFDDPSRQIAELGRRGVPAGAQVLLNGRRPSGRPRAARSSGP